LLLRQACEQIKAWSIQPETAHLSTSINVSARQFHHPDFVDMMLANLAASEVDPNRLMLEITESLLLDNIDETVEKMNALKERGIRFSIDDFGTGYSSLAYLKRLPLDELKIDRSFVADIETDDNDAAICATFISLAHLLGLRVVAEGVENEAQRNFLAATHNCDAMQGYLFGKPMPAEQIANLSGNSPQ
jgi:EAL domain-containing protein (putative c-di-GMP-specific phosphodiesterase class I)